jgi:4-hydroxybenzoate polyprenyltransferase
MKFLLYNPAKFLDASRFKDWRYSFIPNIFGNIYLWLFLFNIPVSIRAISLLFCSLITSIGFAALGYFINEYFDKEDDSLAGKPNKLLLLKHSLQYWLLLIILAFAFTPWIFLPKDNFTYALMLSQLVLFLLYSAPPFRLKKNWLIATIIDALYAYVFPFILSSYTYYLFSPEIPHVSASYLVWITYVIILFFVGVRNITIHNINDIFNDKKIGISTLPRRLGVNKTDTCLRTSIYIELLLSAVLCCLLFTQSMLLGCGVILVFYQMLNYQKNLSVLPTKKLVNQSLRHTPDYLFQFLFPVLFLSNLVFHEPLWSFLIILHVLLFIPTSTYKPLISFLIRLKIRFHKLRIELKHILSLVINYSIYFGFLLFGVNLIKERKSAWQYIKNKLTP